MVNRGKQIAIAPRRLLELLLFRGHCRAALLHSRCLHLRWTRLYTARPAIKADSTHAAIVDHSRVVDVVHDGRIDIRYTPVVVVVWSAPIPAIKAATRKHRLDFSLSQRPETAVRLPTACERFASRRTAGPRGTSTVTFSLY